MGCSSSALNKAGDSSRFGGGVPSNENSSTVEQIKFCVAQPKPCTPGREAAFYGNAQRESHPPPERPKASVVPTANGVKSYHQPSLANDEAPGKDATDQSGLTKKIEPRVQGEECEPPQPGAKDNTLGTEEMKEDVEASTEAQPGKGNAEEAMNQPQSMPTERHSPGAGNDTEIPQTGVTKLLETAESILSPETAKELPPEGAVGEDAQPQLLEATPKENNSAETVEGSQSAESSGQQRPWETPGKAEQPQDLEIILKDNEALQSQLVQMPATNESPCDGPRSAQESQPEANGGSREQLAATAETAANVEPVREIHTNKEEQHIEGETGEKVEAEMKNEKESEEAETKEKDTGEAVDHGAAEASNRRASAHSVRAEQENLRP
ncbi:glutamate-rich protein 5 [Acomys russatus]|uniref:glutamate-rich protein 5 n=1 Tax=Acomys russatus TaxID=60746 RepID=UPI0021E3317B|nr:glutamate-rich protein 5 [Acomys russatus]